LIDLSVLPACDQVTDRKCIDEHESGNEYLDG